MGVLVKMSLRKQVSYLAVFLIYSSCLTFINGQESSYFLYKDPLGVMVNYTGSIELGNVPHGFGIGMFLDENPSYTYTGEWRHGLATGFGKIQYANGDSYNGETRNRIRYGFGQYISITGDTFIGQWRNGRKSGFGIMVSWKVSVFSPIRMEQNMRVNISMTNPLAFMECPLPTAQPPWLWETAELMGSTGLF